jgi:diacylglycerol O-acyltransferase
VTPRRLTGLDSAFLAAELPGNWLHVMAVLVLDPESIPGGYSFGGFREFIARRLHLVPPLRRRLLEVPFGLARPLWVEEPDLDLELHVRRAAVPSPGGPREVAALAAEIDERPLERSRPLWEMVVVEGLAHGRFAVVAKLHHSMMDGMAGLRHMASLFSPEPGLDEPGEPARQRPSRVPGDLALLAGAVPSLLRQPLRAARAGVRTLASGLRDAAQSIGREEAEPPPTTVRRMSFNAHTTAHRAVAYTALPLAELKAAGRPLSATVNDVLLAVVAGALRRYLGPRGELPAEPLVAAVPLSTHVEGEDRDNALSSSSVSLATHLEDPAERLAAIRDASSHAKRQRRSALGDSLADWLDVPPPLVFSFVARAYIGLRLVDRMPLMCNLLVSSVNGPPSALYFGGARIVGLYPLGPVYDGMALNVTALRCGDSLDVGLVACRGVIRDLWEIADAMPEALAELTKSGVAGAQRVRAS